MFVVSSTKKNVCSLIKIPHCSYSYVVECTNVLEFPLHLSYFVTSSKII